MIDVVGLDADDTLWHNESYFALTQSRFRELLEPYTDEPDLMGRLDATERRNIEIFGYGVKGFLLSMIETAIEVTDGNVPTTLIRDLIEQGKWILTHPVELLDGVAEVVEELSGSHRLVVITKGDLFHQEAKVAGSGLAERFWQVEVVAEKDVATYQRILSRHEIAPERFVMVGNSVRSDILPVLALGARAVHIPHEITWSHEHVEGANGFPVLASIRDLPTWLRTQP